MGKSVRFPTGTSGSGATIGVDFMLPDGSVPTLQQLAAALATGAAIQDQPGNIIPPGGGPPVFFQNIQYVPPNVIYPVRPVVTDDDVGEDYYRMAVPGPIGPQGIQGFHARFQDDPEDPITQPGPPGATGPAGQSLLVMIPAEDAEDPISVPGSAGPPGATGPSGTGSPGAPGVTIPMYPDDAEDALPIPGPVGPQGAAGFIGAPGVMSTVHLWPDDVEDPSLIPGPKGDQGIQGPAGSSGASSAGNASMAAWLDWDQGEDPLPQAPSSMGANPSMLIGLTAVNGTRNTFMRSDAAPALDQSIVPTWAGAHTFTAGLTTNAFELASDVGSTYGGQWRMTNSAAGATNIHKSFRLNPTGNLEWINSAFSAVLMSLLDAGNLVVNSPTSGDGGTFGAGSDLTGVLVSGVQNNVGLTISNGQAGGLANWRLMATATGSGFGAGNLVIGRGTSPYITITSAGAASVIGALSASNLSGTNTGDQNLAPYALLSGATFTGAVNGNTSGFQALGAAATQVNGLTISQSGQTQWIVYQPASSNDLRIWNGVNGDRIIGTSAGNWTINAPTSGTAAVINAVATQRALQLKPGDSASIGLDIADPGANAVTLQLSTTNSSTSIVSGGGANSRLDITANGHTMQLLIDGSVGLSTAAGGPTGLGTLNATGLFLSGANIIKTGTFTGTLTGCTTSPTATWDYAIVNGTICTITCRTALTATSNTAAMTVTGLPAVAQPARTMVGCCSVTSAGTLQGGTISTAAASGTITFALINNTSFASTGGKGLSVIGTSFTYSLT